MLWLEMETINETELKAIIKETVQKVLNNQKNNLLTEMSLRRKDYKERLANELPQVIINWCLVHYCSISGRVYLKEHWKDELRGHIYNMSSLSIKENDSAEKRLKVLRAIWQEDDYDKPDNLTLKVCNKFIKEDIDINSEEYIRVIQDCLHCADALFDVILSRNVETIRNYVETI